jgi:hypothetical protein
MPLKPSSSEHQYHFVVYIDSTKPKSLVAAERLKQLCLQQLIRSYTLEIVDLRDNQKLLEEKKIIAAPTLDIETPTLEKHRFIGDLSYSEEFIIAVGFMQKAEEMGKEATNMRNRLKTERLTNS